jgi:acetyl-CoA acetyltransferase family protein
MRGYTGLREDRSEAAPGGGSIMKNAVIVDACRTPIGKKDGWLRGIRADDLMSMVLHALVERSGVPGASIDDVVIGCVTQIGEQGVNIARNAVLAAGLPVTVPGTSVNRLCGSSQQAVSFAAQSVMAGMNDLVVGGGTESMTRVAMGSDVGTFSEKLTDHYELVSQGVSAELVAERWGITREEVDRFSYESHRKALHAQAEGHFKREILPVEVREGEKVVAVVQKDEGPRADTSAEKIGKLKPVFKPDGVITAGSSSQISDGAAGLLITSEERAKALGLKPRARFVSMVAVGVDPTMMLTGPIPATRKVLEKAGLKLSDIDLFEVNEAFASVVLAWQKELGVNPAKVNVNGGAVALGHPLGASGARLLTTLLHELERQELRYGLATMCIGMGQGTGTIIERL